LPLRKSLDDQIEIASPTAEFSMDTHTFNKGANNG
jgi:hypothetical protein